MALLRQRHLFALATYGLPPRGPSKPRRIPLPGPPAPPACPDLPGAPSILGTLSGSLSGSRPQCGPSHPFNIFAPPPGTFLHTSHARNSSNPFFVFKSLRTLSFSVSCKPCVRHSYANRRGGYQQFPTWNQSLITCNRIQVLYFHILPDSFALSQRSILFFSCTSGLFAQNTRGGGRAPVAFLKRNLNSPRISRGINGLRGVAERRCLQGISP